MANSLTSGLFWEKNVFDFLLHSTTFRKRNMIRRFWKNWEVRQFKKKKKMGDNSQRQLSEFELQIFLLLFQKWDFKQNFDAKTTFSAKMLVIYFRTKIQLPSIYVSYLKIGLESRSVSHDILKKGSWKCHKLSQERGMSHVICGPSLNRR